jgi:methyl-accepting chemotaxis protein
LVATVRPVHAVVERLGGSADLVSSASGQVSQASQALAEGASEQASSLEETSASLEEMAAMTKQNADNARQASAMANESRASAGKGHDAMVRMVEAIGRIKTSSDQTAKILKTIDEIAFQTNLLALNAAVEAARAGDAGRGFAVVAEEVRNLAQRCAEAARTTSALIEDAQTNSDNGVSVSGEVAGILKQIVASTDKATHLISEVSAATEEQSRGIEQVNTAVAQMDKVTQSNAANAEESASASEELSAQARELRGLADVLATVVSGTPNQVRPLASPAPLPSHTLAAQGQHVASSRVQGLLAHAGGGGNSKRAPAARNRVADRAANNPPSPAETIPLDDEELKRF